MTEARCHCEETWLAVPVLFILMGQNVDVHRHSQLWGFFRQNLSELGFERKFTPVCGSHLSNISHCLCFLLGLCYNLKYGSVAIVEAPDATCDVYGKVGGASHSQVVKPDQVVLYALALKQE